MEEKLQHEHRNGGDWFEGKTALVTGAGHGIGKATTKALLAVGADVIAVDVDQDRLRLLEKDTQNDKHVTGALFVEHADMGEIDPGSWGDALCKRRRTPDLVVNNVGINSGKSFLELQIDEFDRTMAVNLRGPWFVTKSIVEKLIEEKRQGTILFILSLHSSKIRLNPDYSTSKAALSMLVKEMAAELGGYGIRVNGLSPGAIDTWTKPGEQPGRRQQKAEQMVALKRLGEPDDLTATILHLLNDNQSGYMTGSNIVVDGGLGLYNWLQALND